MTKQTMVYPYPEIPFRKKKKKKGINYWYMQPENLYEMNLYESPGNSAEWKMAISRDDIVYDFSYITFLKWKENYRNGDQISGCHRLKSDWDNMKELYVMEYSVP